MAEATPLAMSSVGTPRPSASAGAIVIVEDPRLQAGGANSPSLPDLGPGKGSIGRSTLLDGARETVDLTSLVAQIKKSGAHKEEKMVPEVQFTWADEDSVQNELRELYSYAELRARDQLAELFQQRLPELACVSVSSATWLSLGAAEQRTCIESCLEAFETSSVQDQRHAACVLLYLSQGVPCEATSQRQQLATARSACELMREAGCFSFLLQGLCQAMSKHLAGPASSADVHVTKIGDAVLEYEWMRADADVSLYANLVYTFLLFNRDEDDVMTEVTKPRSNGQPLLSLLFAWISSFTDPAVHGIPIKKLLLLLRLVVHVALGGTAELAEWKTAQLREYGLEPPETRMRTKATPRDVARFERRAMRKYAPEHLHALLTRNDAAESTSVSSGGTQSETDDDTDYEEVGAFDATQMPPAIREAADVMQRHVHIPVGEVDPATLDVAADDSSSEAGPAVVLMRDDDAPRADDPQAPRPPRRSLIQDPSIVEETYQMLLPEFSKYVITLLKILLAAAPSGKAYTGPIVLSDEITYRDGVEVPQSLSETAETSMDEQRHKEIVVKAVTSLLLLLLKHFRSNHLMQFAFFSQVLVDANCILLILKFLNQDIVAYVTRCSDLPELEVLLPTPEELAAANASATTAAAADGDAAAAAAASSGSTVAGESGGGKSSGGKSKGSSSDRIALGPVSWRNMYSVINVLRVLQKLTKNNVPRVLVLKQFKGSVILKRLLKINHPLMRRYVLKLLKSQVRFMDRKWRTSNMRIVSAIYRELSTGLCDNWLSVEDVDDRDLRAELEQRDRVRAFNAYHYLGAAVGADVSRASSASSLQPGQQSPAASAAAASSSVDGLAAGLTDEHSVQDSWSALYNSVEIDDQFTSNYEDWLEREVYSESDAESDYDL